MQAQRCFKQLTMKRVLFFLAFVIVTAFSQNAMAKSGEDAAVLERVQLLNATVFGTKDSATLDGLLAAELSYGHSGGKVENRPQALHAATVNSSTYSGLNMSNFSVSFAGKVAIVRYIVAVEQITNGNGVKLNLGMLQVWVKEGKQWKLTARQAVKVPV
jgi:hypothetical protein